MITVNNILTNPIYAGAYAFGRTQSRVSVEVDAETAKDAQSIKSDYRIEHPIDNDGPDCFGWGHPPFIRDPSLKI